MAGERAVKRLADKDIVFFIAIVLLTFLTRLPAFAAVILDVDEAHWASIATVVLEGGDLYVDGAEAKPPLMFYVYAGTFYLFGRNNMPAVHVVMCLWVILSALVLWRITRLFQGGHAGPISAVFYVIYTSIFYPKMVAANGEIFMNLFLFLGVFHYLQYVTGRPGHLRLILLAGFWTSIASLFKQVGGFNLAILLAHLFIYRSAGWDFSALGRRLLAALVMLAGFCIPWVAAVAFFFSAGTLKDFYFWSWEFPLFKYVPSGFSHGMFFYRILGSWVPFLIMTAPLVYLIFGLIRRLTREKGREAEARPPFGFLWVWLFGSIVPIMMGGRMHPHYFLQIVPAMAVASSVEAGRRLIEAATDPARFKKIVTAIALFSGITCIGFLAFNINYKFAMKVNNDVVFDYRPVAEYINKYTGYNDRIFVWGWYPILYTASDRVPASKFATCLYLVGGYVPLASQGRSAMVPTSKLALRSGMKELIDQLERNRAVLIADTAPAGWQAWDQYPIKNYPELHDFISERYVFVAAINKVVIYKLKD